MTVAYRLLFFILFPHSGFLNKTVVLHFLPNISKCVIYNSEEMTPGYFSVFINIKISCPFPNSIVFFCINF